MQRLTPISRLTGLKEGENLAFRTMRYITIPMTNQSSLQKPFSLLQFTVSSNFTHSPAYKLILESQPCMMMHLMRAQHILEEVEKKKSKRVD